MPITHAKDAVGAGTQGRAFKNQLLHTDEQQQVRQWRRKFDMAAEYWHSVNGEWMHIFYPYEDLLMNVKEKEVCYEHYQIIKRKHYLSTWNLNMFAIVYSYTQNDVKNQSPKGYSVKWRSVIKIIFMSTINDMTRLRFPGSFLNPELLQCELLVENTFLFISHHKKFGNWKLKSTDMQLQAAESNLKQAVINGLSCCHNSITST